MASLENNGIEVAYLTLHVGVGTFQPIRTENVIEHKMQAEQFHIPKSTVKSLKDAIKSTRDIIAVGSTATRVLEAVDLDTLELEEISGWTDRFIYPGQNFEMVNHMLTNFHLPKSTLYLLVCAFAGKNLIEEAYKKAIEQKYRFFSYGDAMLII
jgi:S-adenosylmethionine:tRNA ribosyltransferase-isomerase